MSQLTDFQRNFICVIRNEPEKRRWGFLKFKEQFPKFIENITRRQFTYMVSNFKQNGTIQRRTGSGRPGLSMEIADQVVANLTTPSSYPHRKHKSQREVESLLGIAQSTVSNLAKLRKLKCFRRCLLYTSPSPRD